MAMPVKRVTAMAVAMPVVMATDKAKKGGQFVFSLGKLF